jgi:hypothetical protein
MREEVLNHFGIDKQIDKAIDELDELKEALIDYKMDKSNMHKIEHVKEESCDVANMIAQIDDYLNYKMCDKIFDMECKMIRTKKRIETGWVKYR